MAGYHRPGPLWGLRTPSETLSLRWGDVNWAENRITVRVPKLEHIEGKGERIIPLFGELRPYLEAAFDEAAEGTVHVITQYRDGETNLRTELLRIIRRAGLTPWPRVFHNLRGSRENELAAVYPIHVAAAWCGNTSMIAAKHYLTVTDNYFATAIGNYAENYADRNGQEDMERTEPAFAGSNPALPLKNREKGYPGQESNL